MENENEDKPVFWNIKVKETGCFIEHPAESVHRENEKQKANLKSNHGKETR